MFPCVWTFLLVAAVAYPGSIFKDLFSNKLQGRSRVVLYMLDNSLNPLLAPPNYMWKRVGTSQILGWGGLKPEHGLQLCTYPWECSIITEYSACLALAKSSSVRTSIYHEIPPHFHTAQCALRLTCRILGQSLKPTQGLFFCTSYL